MGNTFYYITIVLLVTSYIKDKEKTKQALKKGFNSFNNILPEFITVIIGIGILLAVVSPSVISSVIGETSGSFGVLIAGIIGSITLMPAFVAFPTAGILLENGAGITQIAAFVSTLMMVGVLTIPVEKKFFGSKVTYLRNFLAFIFSFLVAYIIGGILK